MDELKNWPTALFALALVFGGIYFWPSKSAGVSYADTSLKALPETYPEEDVERKPVRSQDASGDGDDTAQKPRGLRPPGELPEAETRFIEHMIAVPREPAPVVTHTQDDPEVKAALRNVRIEMYEADWCGVCRQAREYFAHNQLSYVSYDVDQNVALKEKARRLSGGNGVPVIVIDGKVTSGFSEGSVQGLLLAAVQTRMSGK